MLDNTHNGTWFVDSLDRYNSRVKKKRKKKTSTYVHVTDLGVTESLAAMLALQRNFKQAS